MGQVHEKLDVFNGTCEPGQAPMVGADIMHEGERSSKWPQPRRQGHERECGDSPEE